MVKMALTPVGVPLNTHTPCLNYEKNHQTHFNI